MFGQLGSTHQRPSLVMPNQPNLDQNYTPILSDTSQNDWPSMQSPTSVTPTNMQTPMAQALFPLDSSAHPLSKLLDNVANDIAKVSVEQELILANGDKPFTQSLVRLGRFSLIE